MHRARRTPVLVVYRKFYTHTRALGAIVAGCALLALSDAAKPQIFETQIEADQDLEDFGKKNPSCEIWSNWQTTCSRLGASISCSKDLERPVKPSSAFCVGDWESVNQNRNASQLRFCKTRGDIFYSKDKKFTSCSRYDIDRPFNGRRLKARLSPACSKWKKEKTNAPASAYSESGFYCAEFKLPRCTDYSDHHRKIEQTTPDDSGIIVTERIRVTPDSRAVAGVSCGVDR